MERSSRLIVWRVYRSLLVTWRANSGECRALCVIGYHTDHSETHTQQVAPLQQVSELGKSGRKLDVAFCPPSSSSPSHSKGNHLLVVAVGSLLSSNVKICFVTAIRLLSVAHQWSSENLRILPELPPLLHFNGSVAAIVVATATAAAAASASASA